MEDFVGTTMVILGALGVLGLFQGSLTQQEKPLVWIAFALRIVSSIAMVELTRGVLGGGDMLNYHKVGVALSERLSNDDGLIGTLFQLMAHQIVPTPVPFHGIGSSTGAMNAVSAFIVFLGNGSIYGACAFVGFASFFGCLGLYFVAREELPQASPQRLLVACLLVPSVVFWSSALLKESIVLSGVGLMVVGGHWIARHRRFLRGGIVMLLGTAIVAMLKAYILVPFGLSAGLWFYMVALRKDGAPHLKALNLVMGSVLAAGLVVGTGQLFPEYSLDSFADEAAKHQETGARYTGAADYVLADEAGVGAGSMEDRSLGSQLQLAPLALFTALFRPLIFEAGNGQMLVNGLEMSAVLWLALLGGYRCGFRGFLRRISQEPLLMFCAAFAFSLALGVGLATTNLGTLSRYRMPLMPFFLILLVELAYRPTETARFGQPVRAG